LKFPSKTQPVLSKSKSKSSYEKSLNCCPWLDVGNGAGVCVISGGDNNIDDAVEVYTGNSCDAFLLMTVLVVLLAQLEPV